MPGYRRLGLVRPAKIGGSGVSTPACAPLGTGQVVCIVLGINNKLTSVVGP